MKPEYKTVTVRMPPELHAALKKLADQRRQSLNECCVVTLMVAAAAVAIGRTCVVCGSADGGWLAEEFSGREDQVCDSCRVKAMEHLLHGGNTETGVRDGWRVD